MKSITKISLLLLLPVFCLWNGIAMEKMNVPDSTGELSGKKTEDTILYSETFSYPDGPLPSIWWCEGNTAVIKDGRLYVNADLDAYRASTVWLDKRFSGNIQIEFDVQIVSSGDTANNINCFFMYSDPEGNSLRETAEKRKDGVYNHYHKLNGYIFTFVGNKDPDNARVRFRDNPGFKLLKEDFGANCEAGKTYQIKIVKKDNRFQYWVNGVKRLDKVDDAFNHLHNEGLFGFRTWHTALWWDNLKIIRAD